MSADEAPIVEALNALGIAFERHEHPPIASAVGTEELWPQIDGVQTKNLFLTNAKRTRFYLVVLDHVKRADLRLVSEQIGDGRLSFGSPERLMTHLKVAPGSVSALGLIHDTANAVTVYLDEALKAAARISFHPNINTVTLVLSFADFLRFLRETGHEPAFIRV
ncbi:MAG TPA: prolyl-tRNA synthetase associated domain-containing protein [Vicinamibacterales bacterium]|nr:prolyl-tRNA synthetase associated domain-containing protein [Vicinamibacterales bacterium]